jgi:serine/threonine-protein kinase RsbW
LFVVEKFVTLDIPAKGEYVMLARLALAGLLRDQRFSDDAVTDLKLAVTEACSNSVRHAYHQSAAQGGQIRVSFRVMADRLVLVVEDDGNGSLTDEGCEEGRALEPGSLPTEGSMGMCIIRAVVDDFLLERPDTGGMRLTLTKLCDA